MSYAREISTDFFRLSFEDQGLFDTLATADDQTQRRIRAVMEYNAPKVEAHMKFNAPWTDRTGNARQGLSAQAFEDGPNHGIILFHTVPYGIWLEVRFNGRYAIIDPTIEVMGPQVMASLANILGDIDYE